VRGRPNSNSLQVCDQDSVMEFGLDQLRIFIGRALKASVIKAPLQPFSAKDLLEIPMGSPPTRVTNTLG